MSTSTSRVQEKMYSSTRVQYILAPTLVITGTTNLCYVAGEGVSKINGDT